MDSNGNGIPNEPEDVTLASRQPTGQADSTIGDSWAPYIVTGAAPTKIEEGHGLIQAKVLDNKEVRRVWAVIYPPSYRPPTRAVEIVPDTQPTIVLHKGEGDSYQGEYTGFDEPGTYRIVLYAEDNDGLLAQPRLVTGPPSQQLYVSYIQGAVQP